MPGIFLYNSSVYIQRSIGNIYLQKHSRRALLISAGIYFLGHVEYIRKSYIQRSPGIFPEYFYITLPYIFNAV